MFKDSSAKYYKKQRKPSEKSFERYQDLSQEEKKKHDNMIVKDIKIAQRVKNKS